MPTRILREGIITSEKVNALSCSAEVFYRRLMSVVDDYGRYFANLQLLRSSCYPLKTDEYPPDVIEGLLQECKEQQLITVYEVDGKRFLQIENFGQQIRSKSKFPPPEGCIDESKEGKIYFIRAKRAKKIKIGYTEWRIEARLATLQIGSPDELVLVGWIKGTVSEERALHKRFDATRLGGEWFSESEELTTFIESSRVQVISSRTPLRSESESESDPKSESLERENGNGGIPTFEEVKSVAAMRGVLFTSAQAFYDHYQGNNLWLNRHGRLIDWKHKLTSWQTNGRKMQNGSNGKTALDEKREKFNDPNKFDKGF